jgi:hypothetical protein
LLGDRTTTSATGAGEASRLIRGHTIATETASDWKRNGC